MSGRVLIVDDHVANLKPTRLVHPATRAAGCDGYLTKPMDVQRLPGQVRAWLGRVKK